MKTVVAFIAMITISNVFAYECSKNEAQFIGTVKDYWVSYDDHGIQDCSVTVEFSDYRDSFLCPIGYEVAAQSEILVENCSQKFVKGQPISGYLVEKNGVIVLD